ncbi:MAG: LamG-like jellyroll fold domain-containing protein, partial [Planctomycetota bacterium]
MFQNILDYQFKSSILPFDGSGFNNHGRQKKLSFLLDGASQSSGAVRFNADDSRISAAHNSSWDDLTAIRVEAIVRFDTLGRRQIIAEGSYSFSFYVRPDGTIAATYLGPKTDTDTDMLGPNIFTAGVLGGGGSLDPFDTTLSSTPLPTGPGANLEWIGVTTDAEFAPNGVTRKVQAGEWTKLLFVHDTISLQIYIDGELSGFRNDIESTVLGVQSAGVSIGASPDNNLNTLDGDLDRIRIWNYDPFARERRFFCRDMSLRQEACWRNLLAKVHGLMDDPETDADMAEVLECLAEAEAEIARAIQDQG